MSLRGRFVIDRVKRAVSSYLRFPAPPCGHWGYWEGAYQNVGPSDPPFEWGNLSFADLEHYRYSLINKKEDDSLRGGHASENASSRDSVSTTTLQETLLGSSLDYSNGDEGPTKKAPILIVGCGNSRFGEDLLEAGGGLVQDRVVIQTDVSQSVIRMMKQRCRAHVDSGSMELLLDDVTEMDSIASGTMAAAMDKGLMDAWFCADEYEHCRDMLKAAHRVLLPGGIFCFLSLSRPEFLLEQVLSSSHQRLPKRAVALDLKRNWQGIQVRQLDSMILYRFQKAAPSRVSHHTTRKKQRRR